MVKRKRKNDRPSIQPSDKVRKCLFGRATEDEKEEELRAVEQENLSNLEKMKVKYGYDFDEDKQLELEHSPYTVAKVIEASCENDFNEDKPSASAVSVGEHTADSTITPKRKCLVKSHSDSKPCSNSVNSRLHETDQNGERNCTWEPDKAFIETNGQS